MPKRRGAAGDGSHWFLLGLAGCFSFANHALIDSHCPPSSIDMLRSAATDSDDLFNIDWKEGPERGVIASDPPSGARSGMVFCFEHAAVPPRHRRRGGKSGVARLTQSLQTTGQGYQLEPKPRIVANAKASALAVHWQAFARSRGVVTEEWEMLIPTKEWMNP